MCKLNSQNPNWYPRTNFGFIEISVCIYFSNNFAKVEIEQFILCDLRGSTFLSGFGNNETSDSFSKIGQQISLIIALIMYVNKKKRHFGSSLVILKLSKHAGVFSELQGS